MKPNAAIVAGPGRPLVAGKSNVADGRPDVLLAVGVTVCCMSAAATIYFCRSMSREMAMPGGWNMSMMWMRMPGQSWLGSAAMFLLMWLTMMVAMMLPSALPMLSGCRRGIENAAGNPWAIALIVAAGYFAVWLVIGLAVYIPGAALMLAAMHSEDYSRAVPWLSGFALMAAGLIQFSRWKMSGLWRCRAPFACPAMGEVNRAAWRHGLGQGVACAICCCAPMLALLVLGAMNLAVMLVVTAVITMEKLAPKPELIVRVSGVTALLIGVAQLARAAF